MGLPCANPASARGQNLYITDVEGESVRAYDLATGTPLAGFRTFVGYVPAHIALSGGILYVADFQNDLIRAYDAATGIATDFLSPSGLDGPAGIAVSGSDLYVANIENGTVGEYDIATGAPVPGFATITGLNQPIDVSVSGQYLYVADAGDDTLHTYAAATGLDLGGFSLSLFLPFPLDAAASGNNVYLVGGNTVAGIMWDTKGEIFGYNAPTGLSLPQGLALWGNDIYVVDAAPNATEVYELDATTGAFVTGYTSPSGLESPEYLTIGSTAPAQPVISSTSSANGVAGWEFDYLITASNNPTSFAAAGLPAGLNLNTKTGLISGKPAATGTFQATISAINTGGTGSATLALDVIPAISGTESRTLYVTNGDSGALGAYDAATGAPIAGFTTVRGINGPEGVALSEGVLYVADPDDNLIHAYDAATGATIHFDSPANLNVPWGLAAAGHHLYVSNATSVNAYDTETGAPIAGFKTINKVYDAGLAVSGGYLYAADPTYHRVIKYDAATGDPIATFTFPSDFSEPSAVAVSGNDMYVAAGTTVADFDARTGKLISSFTPATGLYYPLGLAVTGTDLYVVDAENGNLTEYNAVTGAPVSGYASPSGLAFPQYIAISVVGPSKTLIPAGHYTFLLNASGTSPGVPGGTGYGTMTVGPGGGVIMAGMLPDGEDFSTSGAITDGTTGAQFEIYNTLNYRHLAAKGEKGLLLGAVTFQTLAGSDFTGMVEWTKPSQIHGRYQGVIETTLNVLGSRYTPPPQGGSVLPGFTAGLLYLSDPGVPGISPPFQLYQDVILNPDNSLQIAGYSFGILQINLSPATGVFRGTFLHPSQTGVADFGGVLFQDQPGGGGFFLGPNGSGTVSLLQIY